jgi:hypothetical protein
LAEISSAVRASPPHPNENLITSGVRSRDQVPGFLFRQPRINPPSPVSAASPKRPTEVPLFPRHDLMSATDSGEISIISQIAGILNNRC